MVRTPCPRCRKGVLAVAVFCPRCGLRLKPMNVAAPVIVPKPVPASPARAISSRTLQYQTPAKYLPKPPPPAKRKSNPGVWVFIVLGVTLSRFLANIGDQSSSVSKPPPILYPSYTPPRPYVPPRVTVPNYPPRYNWPSNDSAPEDSRPGVPPSPQVYSPNVREEFRLDRRTPDLPYVDRYRYSDPSRYGTPSRPQHP